MTQAWLVATLTVQTGRRRQPIPLDTLVTREQQPADPAQARTQMLRAMRTFAQQHNAELAKKTRRKASRRPRG